MHLRVPRTWAPMLRPIASGPLVADGDQVVASVDVGGDITLHHDTPMGRVGLGFSDSELLIEGPPLAVAIAARLVGVVVPPVVDARRLLRVPVGPTWRDIHLPGVGTVSVRSS